MILSRNMIFVNKKYLYFLIISSSLLFFNFSSFSQSNIDEELKAQFKKANELYNKEEYFDAITELKRLLFFDKKNEYSYSANELIGKTYKIGAKFSEAVQYFFLAGIHSSNNVQLYNSKIEIIKINILRRTISRALTLLDSLSSDICFNDKKSEITYWRGWAYIFDDKWEQAAREFKKLIREKN